ncbi:MAG: hypothetical protein IPK80_33135 [Nannocystis sp.]|nr:hypothetical protein [Nannocystis sp.]
MFNGRRGSSWVCVLMMGLGSAACGSPVAPVIEVRADAELDALIFERASGIAAESGACCDPHVSGGCEEEEVAACVCAQDPFCCQGEWDERCVAEIELLGCGGCGDLGEVDCCLAHGSASCVDEAIAACVCAYDAYCCEDMWDDGCVSAVESRGCGRC